MHLFTLALAVSTLAAGVASANTATPRVDRREWRQHQRIREGWRSEELTRGERARLRAGQRRVHRMEWRAKRDGHVDRFERRRLNRAENRQSRRIYRLKHNRRSRTF
jgi:outer membrane biogenesis lipoprotein LolB